MYSIQDVSKKTGLSAHTLRYYEKEGLISGVERTQGGFRQYTDEDLERLGLICCLKNTGMSIQEIARFVQLTHEGDHTLQERVELLREHRDLGHHPHPFACADDHRARIRLKLAGDDAEKRGLSGSVASEYADVLPLEYLKGEAVEHVLAYLEAVP